MLYALKLQVVSSASRQPCARGCSAITDDDRWGISNNESADPKFTYLIFFLVYRRTRRIVIGFQQFPLTTRVRTICTSSTTTGFLLRKFSKVIRRSQNKFLNTHTEKKKKTKAGCFPKVVSYAGLTLEMSYRRLSQHHVGLVLYLSPFSIRS